MLDKLLRDGVWFGAVGAVVAGRTREERFASKMLARRREKWSLRFFCCFFRRYLREVWMRGGEIRVEVLK